MEKNINEEQKQSLDEKLDIILKEITNFSKRLEDNNKEHQKMFENVDHLDNKISNFETITKRIDKKIADLDNKVSELDNKVSELDNKVSELDNRLTNIDFDNKQAHKKIFENLDRIDTRITSLKSDNTTEHNQIKKHLDTINSAFIRYETDGIEKLRILFDSDVDRKNHQDIYGHEFKRLNDLIAKNSFRISNLEKSKL